MNRLIQNALLYSALALSTVLMGCRGKDIEKDMKMYRGAATIADASVPVTSEMNYVNHYKSNVGFHRNGMNQFSVSVELLENQLEQLHEQGKTDSDLDFNSRMFLIYSRIGEAYFKGEGYAKADKEIDVFRKLHPNNGIENLIDEADKFNEWMYDTRTKDNKLIYDGILIEAKKRGGDVVQSNIEVTKAYIRGLLEEAKQWKYDDVKLSGWGDEARDVALKKALNYAEWIRTDLKFDTDKGLLNHFNIAGSIYEMIIEEYHDSRLAPRAIEGRSLMHEKLAEYYRKKVVGKSMSNEQRAMAANQHLSVAKRSWKDMFSPKTLDSELTTDAVLKRQMIENDQIKAARRQY